MTRVVLMKVSITYFHISGELGKTLSEGKSEKNPKIILKMCVCICEFF